MVRDAEVKKKDKGADAESVKVVVRCRPMNEKETKEQHQRVVDMDVARGVVEIRNIKASESDPPKTFTYDAVYDWNSKQMDLYNETFRPLVDSVLNGFNGTIFAYGQTGTGKTFTMEGVREDPDLRGVIPNSFDHIFNHIARSTNQQYLIRASYLEIYQEEITDLLGKDQKKKLELKERPDTGVYVKDLQQFVCKSVNEIQHVMTVGNQNRSVGATNMNLHSSRSHAIFIITIENCETKEDGKGLIRVGKLNLVDLAGSERQSKTGAMGERLKEATKINLSLSALGNVISALVDGKSSHIPYRDSKLTRILQDSLGGNSKTIMVANIGPASYNYDETITTLRYANRAKNIKNKPKVNEDPKDAILREYQHEIARLKSQLKSKTGKKKKKKKEHQEDGEEEEEEEGIDPDFIVQQEKELEEDRNRIHNNQEMLQEEKEQFLQEVKKKEAEVEATKKAQESLIGRIKTMESKLLSGGKNIIDHTNEQQQAIEQRSQEIMDQKKLEREMLQRLEKEEETSYEVEQTYNGLQQEVEAKTRKLKKLFAKLQSVKTEMTDMHEEFCRDRVDLQQTQDVLTRELKLKALIIENFISPEEKRKILSRAFFDEDEDIWKLRHVVKQSGSSGTLKRPVSSASRRPTSEYARMQASLDHNPRFKGENIMIVELDGAVRTTREWEGPTVAPRVTAALEAALTPMDDDLSIDASTILSRSHAVKSQRKDRTKGKFRPSFDKDDIVAVIKKCKQTMNSIIPEIQEWDPPPLPSAGQLSLPQVSWPGTQVTLPGTQVNLLGTKFSGTQVSLPRSWSPDSFRAFHHDNDDYYEDPSDFLMLSSIALDDSRDFCEKERIFCNLRFDFPEIHSRQRREHLDSEKDRDSTEDLGDIQDDDHLEPKMLQEYILDNDIDGFWENYQLDKIKYKEGKELILTEPTDLNKIKEFELENPLENKEIINITHDITTKSLKECENSYKENMFKKSGEDLYNNPNVFVGPFGVCRTCYHYKPQVKRCATKALFWKPNKLLCGSSYIPKTKKTDSYPHSSSSLCCKTLKDCSIIRKNSFHKMDKRKFQKNHWRRFWGNVPCRFSSLVRKKQVTWYSSLHPFMYERIFWRLPCPIWRQIVNLLTNIDDENITSLNPVMFSMNQISSQVSVSSSQMVYSLSQDSYGDTDMLKADLSLGLCIGCLLVFLHRVLRGFSLLLGDLYGCCNVDASQQIMWLVGEALGLILFGIYYKLFLRKNKNNNKFSLNN